MSNELSAQDLLPPEIGLTLLGFEKSEQGWLVRAEGRTRSECPSCRTQSTARHSRYWRQLQDLPVQGKRVALQLRLSRCGCRNRECEQAIFRERLGEVVAPWARRTSRVVVFHRVARPHYWGPALSEPDVRLSYSSGSSPSNASFRETRFRYGNMLAVNPVVALWMKQNAVICTCGTTRHTRNAIMNAPARDPGDLGVAHGTGSAL